jgi:D-tyrosyl-tRNA(Tyr) deacylase
MKRWKPENRNMTHIIYEGRKNMKVVIQRVSRASVTIDQKVKSSIGKGMLVLLGVADGDTQEEAQWLAKKIAALRIFDDSNGVMNENITAVGGEVLVVSQFTLLASYKKGNRPSWIHAAEHSVSIPLYE